jgi:hypothetical protein
MLCGGQSRTCIDNGFLSLKPWCRTWLPVPRLLSCNCGSNGDPPCTSLSEGQGAGSSTSRDGAAGSRDGDHDPPATMGQQFADNSITVLTNKRIGRGQECQRMSFQLFVANCV